MREIYIESEIMLNEKYRRKIIGFLKDYCDTITYGTLVHEFYDLSSEEYSQAMVDFTNEITIEDKIRRARFADDIQYKNELLNKFHTSEKVYEYFDLLKAHDNIELGELEKTLNICLNKELIIQERDKLYEIGKASHMDPEVLDGIYPNLNERSKNEMENKDMYTMILPGESFIGTKFTSKSHCTIGGIYKVFEFKFDQNMLDYLIQNGELTKLNCFQDITMLEDPGFYRLNQLVCSICSHNQTFFFFLDNEQIINLKELDVPFVWC